MRMSKYLFLLLVLAGAIICVDASGTSPEIEDQIAVLIKGEYSGRIRALYGLYASAGSIDDQVDRLIEDEAKIFETRDFSQKETLVRKQSALFIQYVLLMREWLHHYKQLVEGIYDHLGKASPGDNGATDKTRVKRIIADAIELKVMDLEKQGTPHKPIEPTRPPVALLQRFGPLYTEDFAVQPSFSGGEGRLLRLRHKYEVGQIIKLYSANLFNIHVRTSSTDSKHFSLVNLKADFLVRSVDNQGNASGVLSFTEATRDTKTMDVRGDSHDIFDSTRESDLKREGFAVFASLLNTSISVKVDAIGRVLEIYHRPQTEDPTMPPLTKVAKQVVDGTIGWAFLPLPSKKVGIGDEYLAAEGETLQETVEGVEKKHKYAIQSISEDGRFVSIVGVIPSEVTDSPKEKDGTSKRISKRWALFETAKGRAGRSLFRSFFNSTEAGASKKEHRMFFNELRFVVN